MRTLLAAVGMLLILLSQSEAACFGSSGFATCSDANGNSYTVTRFGNQTIMNGSNANTGSTWSMQSNTIGNSTHVTGTANGRSWDATQTNVGGGMRSVYGTDSHGRAFNYNCTQFGCK